MPSIYYSHVLSQYSSSTPALELLLEVGEEQTRRLQGRSGEFQQGCNHQRKENVILFPASADRIGASSDRIPTCVRLGGLMTFYYREAA
jgi:hypothetical protein